MSSFHPPFITVALTILAVFLILKVTPVNFSNKSFPSTSPSATPSYIPSENSVPTPTLTPSPSGSPTETVLTPAPKNSPRISTTLLEFIYPNSKQINISSNILSLESGDLPDSITNWYKDKIKSLGMNTTSFVQTSTNSNVLNKLVGARESKQIKVEISKSASETLVKILVEGLP